MKRYLPDVNVWFALALEEHQHHPEANQWWRGATGIIGFVTLTQIGLLRLLTTAAAMGGKPLTNSEAWGVYDAFRSDGRIRMLPDSPRIEEEFRRLSQAPASAPKLWVDAYLAATADINDMTLVTFDRALVAYGMDCLLLSE